MKHVIEIVDSGMTGTKADDGLAAHLLDGPVAHGHRIARCHHLEYFSYYKIEKISTISSLCEN